MFNAAVEVDLSGHKLRTLSDQDLMLVLCVHAAKHGWRQISWLCDITQLAQSRALDWEGLGIQAGRLGIARIVAVSFLLAQKLLGTSLPERLEAQSDPSVEPLAQKILQQIVRGRRIRFGIVFLLSPDHGFARAPPGSSVVRLETLGNAQHR